MTILAEKIGTYYLPSIHLINLRAQKELVIKDTAAASVDVEHLQPQ